MIGAGLTALGLGAGYGTCGTTKPSSATATQQDPDNTSNNKQQTEPGRTTADQQKETPADRELAQKIRHSIVDDTSLSTYAHNVKVIVRDGVVVLKGPVQSDEEKRSIGSKAEVIAGQGKVKNLLTVKS